MEEAKTVKRGKVSTVFLQPKKIKVQYIAKPTKEITNPNHVAYGGKLEGTYDYVAPPRLRSEKMKNILTDEEKAGLEVLMGTDLSIYGDFWKSYRKGGMFPIALGKSDTVLNLEVPEDYIKWKVLLNTGIVANSLQMLTEQPRQSYKYVLVEEGQNEKADAEKITEQAEAFAFYSKHASDQSALRFILSQLGKMTSRSNKMDFLRTKVGEAISNPIDRQKVIALSKDKNFEIKVLLEEAFGLGVVDRINGGYFTKEGEPISSDEDADNPDIDAAGRFLSSPFGQEMRLAIQKRVENAKDK